MRNPKLSGLDELFDRGTDFQITDADYKRLTGAELPKSKSYLKNSSAFALWAEKKGFVIAEVQTAPIIERTVILKRRKDKK